MLWKLGSQPGSPQGPNKIPTKQERASRQLSKGLWGWRQGLNPLGQAELQQEVAVHQ